MSHPFPKSALKNHVAILGKSGAGKSTVMRGFVENLLDDGERVCIIDPTGGSWGLKSSADGKSGAYPVVIFGGLHADIQIGQNHGKAIAEVVGTSNTPAIIDTSLMGVGERTRFFADFASEILRKNSGPLHLIIDEAHLFAPQGRVSDPQSANMLHNTNNLVSLGRSRGLRITLISQRPAKVHKDSLTQVETIVAMRLMAPQDRQAIQDWIADQADAKTGKEIIASLPTLKTGEGWIWAPELDILKRVMFPLAKTFDSSKAPDGKDKKGPVLAPIDPAIIQERLEVAAVEVMENDPARMKKKIAELEKHIKTNTSVASWDEIEIYKKRAHDIGYDNGWLMAMVRTKEFVLKAIADITDNSSKETDPFTSKNLSATFDKLIESPKPEIIRSVQVKSVAPKTPKSDLGAPQLRIMKSLLFWKVVGYEEPSREQVAAISGYSPNSGNFQNLLGKMKGEGLIQYPSSGRISILSRPTGIENHSFEEAKTMLLSILTGPQQKIVQSFGTDSELGREEIAQRADYSANSGNFQNLIGSLCTLKILSRSRPGMVALADWVREVLS